MTDFHIFLRTSTSEIPTLSRFKVQVYFALFKLIQYKMAYRISRLTNNEKYIQVCWYVLSDQSSRSFRVSYTWSLKKVTLWGFIQLLLTTITASFYVKKSWILLLEILLWKRVTMSLHAGDCLTSCAFFHIGYDVFCAKEVDRYYKYQWSSTKKFYLLHL